MKRIVFFILIIVLGIGGYFLYSHFLKKDHAMVRLYQLNQGHITDSWISFQSEEGNFAASFPLNPSKDVKDFSIPGHLAPLKYHEYRCVTEDNRLYSISHVMLPHSLLKWGNNLVLNGALKLIIKDLGQSGLVGKGHNTFKNFPSLDYEHRTKEHVTHGTLILIGEMLYKVEMISSLDAHEKIGDTFSNFIGSFEPIL